MVASAGATAAAVATPTDVTGVEVGPFNYSIGRRTTKPWASYQSIAAGV